MRVQNLGRSRQSAKDFFQSVDEPMEAVVGDQTYVIYPVEFIESLTKLFRSPRVHREMKQAFEDVQQGNFVELHLPGDKRSPRKSSRSGKRSKP